MDNPDKLKYYSFPEADKMDLSGEYEITKIESDKYIIFGWLTIFERINDLCGFEKSMTDILTGESAFLEIRNRVI